MDIPPLVPPLSPAEVRRLGPAALAYVGDAVYELYVRRRHLFPPQRMQQYHQVVVAQVRGEAQAATVHQLHPLLTSAEQEIVRWGSNGCGRPPRHLSLVAYQQASGLETLLGYLYVTDPQRLQEVLGLLEQGIPGG